MLLHIVDDEKFIDFAIYQFEQAAPDKNKWILLRSDVNTNIQFIKQSEKVSELVLNTEAYDNLILNLNEYNAIFLHYLNPVKLEFLKRIKIQISVIWMFWGQDAQKSFTDLAFMPRTGLLLLKNKQFREVLWPFTNWFRRLIFSFTERHELMKKMEYCVPVIKEELFLMNRKLQTNFKELSFNYGYFEESELNASIVGENILVGNSATFTCNHIDIFRLLKNIDLGDKLIITPLNYGDSNYAKSVKKIGYEYFGENFKPIDFFIPYNDYMQLIHTCKFYIMGHMRQQALGNIQMGMLAGAKIFMHKKSVLFHHLKENGYVVYTLHDVVNEINNKENNQNDDLKTNRALITKWFSKTNAILRTKLITDQFLIQNQ